MLSSKMEDEDVQHLQNVDPDLLKSDLRLVVIGILGVLASVLLSDLLFGTKVEEYVCRL